MSDSEHITVAILCGDRVIDASDDPLVVRATAGLMAGTRRPPEPEVLAPITAGRKIACRMIAAAMA